MHFQATCPSRLSKTQLLKNVSTKANTLTLPQRECRTVVHNAIRQQQHSPSLPSPPVKATVRHSRVPYISGAFLAKFIISNVYFPGVSRELFYVKCTLKYEGNAQRSTCDAMRCSRRLFVFRLPRKYCINVQLS